MCQMKDIGLISSLSGEAPPISDHVMNGTSGELHNQEESMKIREKKKKRNERKKSSVFGGKIKKKP